MKSILIVIAFTALISVNFFGETSGSLDLDMIDRFNDMGKHKEALELLKKNFDADNPESGLVWRMEREMFDIAEGIPQSNKSEKIAGYTEALDFGLPYLDMKSGEKSDRARVVLYYASNFGSKCKAIGIKESLSNVPELKRLADKALDIDPRMASAYLLKAKIEDALPGILGGDKFKMGLYLSKAMYLDPENLKILHDSDQSFYERNWDAKKKTSIFLKKRMTDGTPEGVSDRQYSWIICDKFISIYKSLSEPAKKDIELYDDLMNTVKR